ncbi:hypothetical protein [Streptomyces sp. NPDC101455]|uniref:hypothetical protein n=1 Tax=Streptomyces sp. NPDC101455 TaxID=3366142 RepID=UPI003815B98C
MSGPAPGAEVVARSLAEPESFALPYDRYAARAGGRHQVLWRRREFVIIAVVAAVTAVAVTVTVLLGGTVPGSRKARPRARPTRA